MFGAVETVRGFTGLKFTKLQTFTTYKKFKTNDSSRLIYVFNSFPIEQTRIKGHTSGTGKINREHLKLA